jgi:hypothetical protein
VGKEASLGQGSTWPKILFHFPSLSDPLPTMVPEKWFILCCSGPLAKYDLRREDHFRRSFYFWISINSKEGSLGRESDLGLGLHSSKD